jgi:hypothetical protein
MGRLKNFFKSGDDTSIAERELLNKTHDEVKQLYHEVNKQHLENAKMLLEVQKAVALTKSDITETAINKAFGVLNHVRLWLIVIGIIVALGGFLGYQSLATSLNAYFKERVEEWLRFDIKGSEGKKSLETLRTQAMLDAYTIRLSRSFAQPYGTHSISLEDSEIKRLVEIIVDIDTEYSDFADALRLVTKSRGSFVLIRPEDEVGRQLTSILYSKSYSDSKKILLIEYLGKDEALLPYALVMLNNEEAHESIKLKVLDNVAFFQPEVAIEFANNNLKKINSLYSKNRLASFLAKHDPTSKEVYEFLEDMRANKPNEWEYFYLGPLSTLLENEEARLLPRAQDKLINALNLGLSTLISDFSAGPRYLAVSFGSSVIAIENPKTLFSDANFVTKVISSSSQSLESYLKALDFFQIEDGNYFLTSILLSLSNSAKLKLENNTTLTLKNVTGKVWLRVIEKAGIPLVEATWRDSAGEVNSALVSSPDGLADSMYEISFDSKAIENMSIRTYNKDYNKW